MIGGAGPPQVPRGIFGQRRIQVVGAVDEYARPVEQRTESPKKILNGMRVCDRVPRVHHQIRVEGVERADPFDELAPPRREVSVGDVQHADGPGVLGQDGHALVAQPEHVALDDGHVTEAGQACRGRAERDEGGCSHYPMVPCRGRSLVVTVRIRSATKPFCRSGPRHVAATAAAEAWAAAAARRRRGGTCRMVTMPELKEKLRADLVTAMKARDGVRTRTLRMALTAITNEEVAGATARELSDADIVKVLVREARKRREAAEAFEVGDRPEQAAAERAEAEVIATYLPAQLADAELADLVAAAIGETGAAGPRAMGQVMKVVTPRVAGRAAGARVAAEVRRQLSAAGSQ